MRKLKILTAVLLLTSLLVPALAQAAENVTEIPVYDMEILPGTWNPLSAMTPEKEFLLEMTSARLYRVTAEGALLPELAAGLPVDVTAAYTGAGYGIPAADRGYAFRIELNPQACWEDGTPITADDWLFTIAQYRLNEKFTLSLAEQTEPGEGPVRSLQETGFDTLEQAREAGYRDFYLDVTRFWGLQGGWMALGDRTRLRDYAIPEGMDEFWVSPAYLYRRYLAAGQAYDRWQGQMLGLTEPAAGEPVPGMEKTGDYQITLILSEASTPQAVAAGLEKLRPIRQELWRAEYATSVPDYSACGPYRVALVEQGRIVLVRNENWYGATDPAWPGEIRCKNLT